MKSYLPTTFLGVLASFLLLANGSLTDAKELASASLNILVPPSGGKSFRSLQESNATNMDEDEDDEAADMEMDALLEEKCQCMSDNVVCLVELTDEEMEASGACHCHDDDIHCAYHSDSADVEKESHSVTMALLESKCDCSSGALTCTDLSETEEASKEDSCHCHGSDVHCEDHGESEHSEDHESHDHDDSHDEEDHDDSHDALIADLESACTCSGSSIELICTGLTEEEEALCHCHGDHVHCDAPHSDEDHDSHDSHDGHDHGHDHASEESTSSASGDGKPWGTIIGASVIVNLCTLTGAVLLGGKWTRQILCRNWNPNPATGLLWINVIIPMFACGTLMATTFFLLLPEALHFIEDGIAANSGHSDHRLLSGGHDHGGDGHDDHGDEVATTWRWAASIVGGFIFPVVLHGILHDHSHDSAAIIDSHMHSHDHPKEETSALAAKNDPEAGDVPETADADTDKELEEVEAAKKPSSENSKTEDGSEDDKSDEDGYVTLCGCLRLKELSLFVSMNFAEMLHNFVDGVFVGAAYVGCSPALGRSVVIATVLHEIPNQLAGYLVMVNQNGIDPVVALGLNFLFGMSVLLGALVILVLDLSELAIGIIFCVSSGMFIHVAAYEMLGTADRNIMRRQHVLWVFLAFSFGCTVIGLVLIDHVHC